MLLCRITTYKYTREIKTYEICGVFCNEFAPFSKNKSLCLSLQLLTSKGGGGVCDCLWFYRACCGSQMSCLYYIFFCAFTILNLCFGTNSSDLLLSYLKDLSLRDEHSAAVVSSCSGRSSHTRMSWLVPRHSNRSCLRWSGLNSWPCEPSLPAICGMAAADILCGSKTGRKPCCCCCCCFLFFWGGKVLAVHSCAAVSTYDLLQQLRLLHMSNKWWKYSKITMSSWIALLSFVCLTSQTASDIHNCCWCWAYKHILAWSIRLVSSTYWQFLPPCLPPCSPSSVFMYLQLRLWH